MDRTDAAEAAARLAATWGGAEEAFRASKSGRNLLENAPELEPDIPFCARESVLDVVPRLVEPGRRRPDLTMSADRDPTTRGHPSVFGEVAEAYERGRPDTRRTRFAGSSATSLGTSSISGRDGKRVARSSPSATE